MAREMNSQQKWMIGIAIAAVAILAALAWNRYYYQSEEPVTQQQNQYGAPQAGLPSAPSAPTYQRTRTGAPTARVDSYQDALDKYGDNGTGYMFQFSNCSGNPGSLTMKVGAPFLIDNRDAQEHSFVISGIGFGQNIDGYDFAVWRATKVGTYMITCDGGGAAEMKVVP
ncbi:hypothetical protein HZA86_01710 [Candidatus Uhrbacteria bacterium]|nr:hypothetical protein [Candidatus Uhrbacteria bacterium]